MNPTLECIAHQYTTRRQEFSREQVPEALIQQICQCIPRTANASNRQSYSIIKLDPAQMERLNFGGSHAFMFCVDFHRMQRLAERVGSMADTGFFMQFVTATVDLAMLAQSAILAAQSLGLATWITNEVYHHGEPDLWELLELPERDVFPLLALCLGYRKEPKKGKKGRLPESAIFHDQVYREPEAAELDEWIAQYDNPDAGLAVSQAWMEQGYRHYLNWFLEKWSPAVGSRSQSDAMLEKLRGAGLL